MNKNKKNNPLYNGGISVLVVLSIGSFALTSMFTWQLGISSGLISGIIWVLIGGALDVFKSLGATFVTNLIKQEKYFYASTAIFGTLLLIILSFGASYGALINNTNALQSLANINEKKQDFIIGLGESVNAAAAKTSFTAAKDHLAATQQGFKELEEDAAKIGGNKLLNDYGKEISIGVAATLEIAIFILGLIVANIKDEDEELKIVKSELVKNNNEEGNNKILISLLDEIKNIKSYSQNEFMNQHKQNELQLQLHNATQLKELQEKVLKLGSELQATRVATVMKPLQTLETEHVTVTTELQETEVNNVTVARNFKPVKIKKSLDDIKIDILIGNTEPVSRIILDKYIIGGDSVNKILKQMFDDGFLNKKANGYELVFSSIDYQTAREYIKNKVKFKKNNVVNL